MSRIGKQPVSWSEGTKVTLSGRVVTVESKAGSLSQPIDHGIAVEIDEAARTATFTRPTNEKRQRGMHGLYRALVANMVEGLEKGFEKRLEIQGVGYNAKMEGEALSLNIGFNTPVKVAIPEGLTVECPTPTEVVVKGVDKQLVGQFAADVRRARPPEPYKGKGIRYAGERVRRKAGKSLGA